MFRFKRAENDRLSAPTTSTATDIDGSRAKEEYEKILSLPATRQSTRLQSQRQSRIHGPPKQIPFDQKKLFAAAVNNDMDTLTAMEFTGGTINQTDEFGWTALMMAACDNNLSAVRFLCENGANVAMKTRKEFSAHDLAESKGHARIVAFLEEHASKSAEILISSSSDEESAEANDERVRTSGCDVCGCAVLEKDKKRHMVSTVHRFNETNSHKFTKHFGIPDSNVGFQMMLRQGWNRENGLGPQHDGALHPVKTVMRKFRSGLGTRQEAKPRVTHFRPFDSEAVRDRRQQPKPANVGQQMRRQKARDRRKEIQLRKLLSSD